mgnify:CR=1 FL=1
MKIYLDNCCYNRPFDNQTHERIHLESEAILMILQRGQSGMYKILECILQSKLYIEFKIYKLKLRT